MSRETMKAIRIHDFGGPDALSHDDVPVPRPEAGEVLIRVAAVALNPPDWYAREGFPGVPRDLIPPMELPMILGTDVSGVVEAVADDVEGFAPGDEVFGLLRFPTTMQSGAYAEYVVAPASDLAHKPAAVDHADAAGIAMAGLTAWQFLIELGHDHPSPFQEAQHRPVPITAGMTVLVNGAAGGVGHLTVQLARWKGARVIAVASGPHESFVRELGADEFIDYTKVDPEDVASDVDIVLDAVGGPDSHRLLRVLKRGGALFPLYMADYDADEVERLGVTTSATQVRASGQQLAELARLIEDETLRVAIDSTYSLAETRQAHERAARGHIQGKIILAVA
jgi:NADPH:quinone reductase-like Zn-dependent oxidoreductase